MGTFTIYQLSLLRLRASKVHFFFIVFHVQDGNKNLFNVANTKLSIVSASSK